MQRGGSKLVKRAHWPFFSSKKNVPWASRTFLHLICFSHWLSQRPPLWVCRPGRAHLRGMVRMMRVYPPSRAPYRSGTCWNSVRTRSLAGPCCRPAQRDWGKKVRGDWPNLPRPQKNNKETAIGIHHARWGFGSLGGNNWAGWKGARPSPEGRP